MKILVIGGGGREHALAWKLAQSERVQRVFVAPGNGGTAADKRLVNVAITDPQALAQFAIAEKITLTVVGPEGPLSRPAWWTCSARTACASSAPPGPRRSWRARRRSPRTS
jgi:phosphoribosylamine-glycine ligase